MAGEQLDPRLDDRRAGGALGRVGAQVGHGRHRHADGVQRRRGVQPGIGHARHDRALAHGDTVERGEPTSSTGEHHPREIVLGEDERLVDRPRGGHVGGRPHLMQGVPLPDRHQPVEEAQRGAARQHLDAHRPHLVGQLARPLVVALGERPPARLHVFVAEHHIGAQLGRAQRRGEAGEPATHDEHVAMAAPVLRAPLPLRLRLAQLAEPSGVPQHLLVQRPPATRPDEGLVVEAGRRERPAELVGGPHHVEAERRPRVHCRHAHSFAHGLSAPTHAGGPVHVDERTGALPASAQFPPAGGGT